MIVREMQIDDLEQVMPIENENFSVPWTENGFFTYLIREDALFLVAEEENEILGYCGVILVPPEGDITNVSVKKAVQGKGTGRALVQEMLRRTKEKGVHTLYLEVRTGNDPAISLYSSLGFEKVGIRKNYYEEPVEDALIMFHKG